MMAFRRMWMPPARAAARDGAIFACMERPSVLLVEDEASIAEPFALVGLVIGARIATRKRRSKA